MSESSFISEFAPYVVLPFASGFVTVVSECIDCFTPFSAFKSENSSKDDLLDFFQVSNVGNLKNSSNQLCDNELFVMTVAHKNGRSFYYVTSPPEELIELPFSKILLVPDLVKKYALTQNLLGYCFYRGFLTPVLDPVFICADEADGALVCNVKEKPTSLIDQGSRHV